jgi:hypothetical protein
MAGSAIALAMTLMFDIFFSFFFVYRFTALVLGNLRSRILSWEDGTPAGLRCSICNVDAMV